MWIACLLLPGKGGVYLFIYSCLLNDKFVIPCLFHAIRKISMVGCRITFGLRPHVIRQSTIDIFPYYVNKQGITNSIESLNIQEFIPRGPVFNDKGYHSWTRNHVNSVIFKDQARNVRNVKRVWKITKNKKKGPICKQDLTCPGSTAASLKKILSPSLFCLEKQWKPKTEPRTWLGRDRKAGHGPDFIMFNWLRDATANRLLLLIKECNKFDYLFRGVNWWPEKRNYLFRVANYDWYTWGAFLVSRK